MSRKLSAAEVFDTVEVDLWGNEYTLRTVTRSVSAKLFDMQKRVQAIDEDAQDSDDVARLMIEMVGMLLKPAEGTPPAGEVLLSMWEGDDERIGLDWLTAFSEALQEEAQARRRPTSPSPNSN